MRPAEGNEGNRENEGSPGRPPRSGPGGGGDLRKDVDAIRDDLNLLKSDLVAAMRDLIGAGRDGGTEARQRLEEAVQERLSALNAATEDLSQRGRNIVRDVERHVHEKPMQTLAIAFGAGFLAGAILLRK
jgi:ElaB/YqjD/DUF883 family membrane-anchored ribosome-binding protein